MKLFRHNYEPPLSQMHPRDLIELSSLDAEMINNTIIISVHVPILSKIKFYLIYLIPIPITRDHNNFILNIDAKHLIEDNTTIAEISLYTLSQCVKTINLVVCNALLLDHLLPINDCIRTVVTHRGTNALCTYRELPYKTQLIKLSEESIYVHVINPILLKISCGQNSEIINITTSKEVYYKKNCKIFNSNEKPMQSLNTTTVKIESKFLEPNFEVFENKTWSNNHIFINQYKNKMDHLMKGFKHLSMDYSQRSKLIEISDQKSFSFFPNFFENLTNYIIMFILLATLNTNYNYQLYLPKIISFPLSFQKCMAKVAIFC